MEQDLFEWDGWDQVGDTAKCFYKPILKVKVGNFEIGTQFASAIIDDCDGVLSFYNDGTPAVEDVDTVPSILVGRFKLKYQIVEDMLDGE